MFSRKPAYSPEVLHQHVIDLERLSKLRDQSIQKARLYSNDGTDYVGEADRYTSNIQSAQKALLYMTEANSK